MSEDRQFPIGADIQEVWAARTVSERKIRTLLAFAYSGRVSLYTDDGELQDNLKPPHIDYARDSAANIERAILDRNRQAWEAVLAAIPYPASTETP